MLEEQIGCGPIWKANPDPRWWVFSSIGFFFPRDAIKKDCTNIGSHDGSGETLFWETRTTREELWSNVVYRIIKMIHPDWIFNIDPLKKKKNNYHRSCENEIETSKNKQFHVMLYYCNYTLVNTRKFKGRKIGGKLKG